MSDWRDMADYKPKRCLSHPLPKSDRTGSKAAMKLVKRMSYEQRHISNWECAPPGDDPWIAGVVFERRSNGVITHYRLSTEGIFFGDESENWRDDRLLLGLEGMATDRRLREPGIDWRSRWRHKGRDTKLGFAWATRNAADKRRPR